jgi:zinc protease
MNRKKQPFVHEVTKTPLPHVEIFHLDNGTPVYMINTGLQEVIKVEFCFRAGRPFEAKPLASRLTGSLIKEGTKQWHSAALAEKIDYYGGSLFTPFGIDFSTVSFQCLTKHFEKILPLIQSVLFEPTFPQAELNTFIENQLQSLQVELSKNDILAYRQITEQFFGTAHPYGYNSHEALYRTIQREDLVHHYEKNYTAANCNIFVSGKINDGVIKKLNEFFSPMKKGVKNTFTPTPINDVPQKYFLEKKDNNQTAIKIGRRLFNRYHEDYDSFYVLNTILGGYFGSRLMENIREEKGYTYNIYSTSEAMRYDGYFYVATEVGNEHTSRTLEEIYKEIDILQNDLVPEAELNMVKNYLLGNALTMIDGPFNVAEIVKTYVNDDLPFQDFEKSAPFIRNVTAEKIRELARKYLNISDLHEVVVGVR